MAKGAAASWETFRLYGKTYDARAWAAAHPGGPFVIESATCLETVVLERLFESSHRFPSKNLDALEGYELKTTSPKSRTDDVTTLTKKVDSSSSSSSSSGGGVGVGVGVEGGADPFFEYAREAVFSYLTKAYPSNPKGEGRTRALLKCVVATAAWVALLGFALVHHWAWAFVAGFQLISWGLVQFHDSSHYAFAGGATRNQALTALWCACSYWPPWLWHRHHVELHHGCTGDYERDPDLRHGAPFMRKTRHAPKERYLRLNAVCQTLAMAVSPGMYFGQTVHYQTVNFGLRRALWKMQNLFAPPSYAGFWWEPLLSLWFPAWISLLLSREGIVVAALASLAYLLGANVCYAANILPDHDTDTSHRNLQLLNKKKAHASWAAKQVAASTNWAGPLWCFLFGGLNYQIEHHLFPRVHHSFYPEIAPILKDACKRFDVPYVHYDSFFDAIAAVRRQLIDAADDNDNDVQDDNDLQKRSN